MKIITGNILDIPEGIICHQVNCQGVMGTGIALQIRRKWPKVYEEYRDVHRRGQLFLGNITLTQVGPKLFVANLCGQDRYGRDKRYTDYNALARCMAVLSLLNWPIYIPYGMGCSNAGGDWKVVSSLIDRFLPNAVVVKLN